MRNGPFHFTHSKVMCWVALDRAMRLRGDGEVPAAHVPSAGGGRRRRSSAYVERRVLVGRARQLHADRPASRDVDASLLMLPLVGYGDPAGARIRGTIDAVNRELRDGDFVYRYRADDGVAGGEGCFLNCSFWLVSALARVGRVDEASALMERLAARANDVGLYAEEIDPRSGAFLGNFPQALVHLALIDAAIAIWRRVRSASQPGAPERCSRQRSPAASLGTLVLSSITAKAASEWR